MREIMPSLPTTTTTMAWNNEEHNRNNNNDKKKKKKKKNKIDDNWMEDIRGSLMIVATVIATLTFQIAINPPGGVWQGDTDTTGGCADNTTCKAGTSVLAFGATDQKTRYEWFILLCTISLSSSLAIIIFLMTGISLRYRIVMWGCIITMCASVLCLATTYIIAIWMVTNPFAADELIYIITNYYGVFWVTYVASLCLFLSSRSLYSSIKNLKKKKSVEEM